MRTRYFWMLCNILGFHSEVFVFPKDIFFNRKLYLYQIFVFLVSCALCCLKNALLKLFVSMLSKMYIFHDDSASIIDIWSYYFKFYSYSFQSYPQWRSSGGRRLAEPFSMDQMDQVTKNIKMINFRHFFLPSNIRLYFWML